MNNHNVTSKSPLLAVVCFLFLLAASCNYAPKSNTFQGGWYLLKSKAKVQISSKDTLSAALIEARRRRLSDSVEYALMFRCLFEHCPEYSYMEDNNPFNHSLYTDNTILQSWFLRRNHSNEVVVAYMYDKSKDIYYCFDTYSRMLYVKGRESLERITVPGKPARLKTELKLNLQTTLGKGSTVWLTGFNPATKSATILIENNQKVDVSMNDLHLLPEYESVSESEYSWKPVSSTNNKD